MHGQDVERILASMKIPAGAYAPVEDITQIGATWTVPPPPEAGDKAQIWATIGIVTDKCQFIAPSLIWNFWNNFKPRFAEDTGQDRWNAATYFSNSESCKKWEDYYFSRGKRDPYIVHSSSGPCKPIVTFYLPTQPTQTIRGFLSKQSEFWDMNVSAGGTAIASQIDADEIDTPVFVLLTFEIWFAPAWVPAPENCDLYPESPMVYGDIQHNSKQPLNWTKYLMEGPPCGLEVKTEESKVVVSWTGDG